MFVASSVGFRLARDDHSMRARQGSAGRVAVLVRHQREARIDDQSVQRRAVRATVRASSLTN